LALQQQQEQAALQRLPLLAALKRQEKSNKEAKKEIAQAHNLSKSNIFLAFSYILLLTAIDYQNLLTILFKGYGLCSVI
jgi:hypothetical protein